MHKVYDKLFPTFGHLSNN